MFIHIDGEGGQLWRRKPCVDDEGHIVSFTRLKDGTSATFTCVAFAVNTSDIIAGDNSGFSWVIRLKGNRFARLPCCGPACSAISCHPSQNHEAIVGYSNGHIAVFDTRSKAVTELLRSHRGAVTAIAYSCSQEHVASISREALVVWSAKRYTKLRQIGMTVLPTDVIFSPHQETVITVTQDGALSMWTSQGILSHRLEPPPAVSPTSYSLAVAPNGQWLAAAPSTPLLLLYDLQHPRLVTAMHPTNQHPILQLSFLADSRTLAALTSDSRITFTDVETARQLYSIKLPSPAAAMCVERRGNYATAVTTGGTISLHDVAAIREAVAPLPAAAEGLPVPGVLKRTAPAALATLDLRPLPPQPAARTGTTAAAGAGTAGQRGRGAARGQSARTASCSRSRSGSWGRARPPRSGQRAASTGSRAAGAQHWDGGERIVRPSSLSPGGTRRPRSRSAGSSASPRRAAPRRSGSSGPARKPVSLTVGSTVPPLALPMLKKLLVASGEFPPQHRPVIWAFLLKLPDNAAAFERLRARGAHECVLQLEEKYPLQDTRLQQRLAALLSQLAHWCPLFAEVSFLPSVAFPLLKVFRPAAGAAASSVAAAASAPFEAAAALLCNWGRHWFIAFPHPPLGLLQRLEAVLAVHDAELAVHCARWPGGTAAVAWELMSTLMTDVLDRSEWLQVWDHVLCNPPWFYPYVVVSYLMSVRVAMLRADRPAACPVLRSRPATLNVTRLLRRAAMALETTPADARVPEEPLRPLPAGPEYAPFDGGYPPQALQAQRGDRVRLLGQRTAIVERRRTLSELQDRGQQLATDTAVMLREREQLAAVAVERRDALRTLELRMARERAVLEAQSKAERLRQISLLEDQYSMHLQRTRQEMRAEVATLEESLARRSAQRAAEMRGREQEEALRALEFEARQRMWAMEQAAARDATLGKLRAEVEAKEAVLDAQHQEALAEMAAADESMALQAQHDAAKNARVAMAAEAARAAAEIDAALLRRELQQTAALRAAAAQQRLRALAERAAAATAAAVATERDTRRGAAQRAGAAARVHAAADGAVDASGIAAREEGVETELEQLAREQREREAILRDVELVEQEAEAQALMLEARHAAAGRGAAADDAAHTMLRELRAEVDRTRLAKAELRAQEEELREYIAALRGEAEAEEAAGGGAAGLHAARDSAASAVLRDVSNSSAAGGGHKRVGAGDHDGQSSHDGQSLALVVAKPQAHSDAFSSSNAAQSEAQSAVQQSASSESHGGTALIEAVPELARKVRAVVLERGGEASGSTFSAGSRDHDVPARSAVDSLCSGSLPELAKVLQAKVRELTRMHEARASYTSPRHTDRDASGSTACGADTPQHLKRSVAAADASSVGLDADSAAVRVDMHCVEEGGGQRAMDVRTEDSMHLTPPALSADVTGEASGSLLGELRSPGWETVSGRPGGWTQKVPRGALTIGEADERTRRGDAAAVHAIIDGLATGAGAASGDSGGDGVCAAAAADADRACNELAPGVAAELAAQLAGMMVEEEPSAAAAACDSSPSEAVSRLRGGPVGDDAGEAAEAVASGAGAGAERHMLRQELREVRGLIAEMREMRDAVASGSFSQPVQADPNQNNCDEVVGAAAAAAARAPRPGVAPGFLAPGSRTGRGGHAFFVGGATTPQQRRGRASHNLGAGAAAGGHMFFVDIADGPKKPPPKPPQPGFMRSTERRLHMHGQHSASPLAPAPPESAYSSSLTPTAESSGASAGRSLGEVSSSDGGPWRAQVTTPVLRPWQRHTRAAAAHAAAAGAQHHGRRAAAAALTVSPSVPGAASAAAAAAPESPAASSSQQPGAAAARASEEVVAAGAGVRVGANEGAHRREVPSGGREQLPGVGQGMDETARMLAELVAEHEGSLMDTAHSEGGTAAGGAGDAGTGDEAVSTHEAAVLRAAARAAVGGPVETAVSSQQGSPAPELHVVTGVAAGVRGLPDETMHGGTEQGVAMPVGRECAAGMGHSVRPGQARSRSRSPRVQASHRESSPRGADLEQLMAGLRAQLASLPMSPRSAADRRRDASRSTASASPTARAADRSRSRSPHTAALSPISRDMPASNRSRSPRTSALSPARHSSGSAPTSPRATTARPPARQVSTQRSARSTSPRDSPMQPKTRRSVTPPRHRAPVTSPRHAAEAAADQGSTAEPPLARSSKHTAQNAPSRSRRPSPRPAPDSRATAAPDPGDHPHTGQDASLRHMHEHPQKLPDAPRAPRGADVADAHGVSLAAWDMQGLTAHDSPSLSISSLESRSVSLSRDRLVAPDDPRGANSAESRDPGAPFTRSTLHTSSVLRDSIAMPVVPEDSALDAPVQSPVREFLARSSMSGGGAHFGSTARRDARRTALFASRPAPRSDSDTTVASTDRRSLSLRGSGVLRMDHSTLHSQGSTSVVNSSDFHSAHAGRELRPEPGSAPVPRDSARTSGRAPFDVGHSTAPAGVLDVLGTPPGGYRGADSATTVTHGSGGSGWTASAAGARGSPRRGVLDSDGSSVDLPAPTLRPSSSRGAPVLVSMSSVSSDAANPISTPKKKQRCTPESSAADISPLDANTATSIASAAAAGPLDAWPRPPNPTLSPLTPRGASGLLRTPPPDTGLTFSPSFTNATESLDFTEGFPSDILATGGLSCMPDFAVANGCPASCASPPPPLCESSPLMCDPWCMPVGSDYCYNECHNECVTDWHCC
eukprot:jgi/Ulvmu1/6492/UM003_0125.1